MHFIYTPPPAANKQREAMLKRFKLKLSLASFQLCRPKHLHSSVATANLFSSPFNPKVLDIHYPSPLPSPPPTTPNHHKEKPDSGWFEGEEPSTRSCSFDCLNCLEGGGGRRKWGSVAVVKRSEDPYGDFRRSMLEMILDKEMVDGKDMEELLRWFLLHNSRHHHADIVWAFTEIWQLLYP